MYSSAEGWEGRHFHGDSTNFLHRSSVQTLLPSSIFRPTIVWSPFWGEGCFRCSWIEKLEGLLFVLSCAAADLEFDQGLDCIGSSLSWETKNTQFANGEDPQEWIDYTCPWNPRGLILVH